LSVSSFFKVLICNRLLRIGSDLYGSSPGNDILTGDEMLPASHVVVEVGMGSKVKYEIDSERGSWRWTGSCISVVHPENYGRPQTLPTTA